MKRGRRRICIEIKPHKSDPIDDYIIIQVIFFIWMNRGENKITHTKQAELKSLSKNKIPL